MPTPVRLLILAQTEPCFSEKYVELVCTAGMTLDGRWIRLYPLPKRVLSLPDYHKYNFISCEIYKKEPSNDKRPESYHVIAESIGNVEPLGNSKKVNWNLRRRFFEERNIPIYTRKRDIMQAVEENKFSLCLFKPKAIQQFHAKTQTVDFSQKEREIIENFYEQGQLFSFLQSNLNTNVTFKRIPRQFYCQFTDDDGETMDLMVLDWEISSLFRKVRRARSSDADACAATLEKYNGFIASSDVHFILGTRNKFHNIRHAGGSHSHVNPWSIISVIPFPLPSDSGQMMFHL